MTELVSIIVPIYNVESYFNKCLSSIQKQSFESFEVIMVDDASTDSSKEIAQKYAHSDSRFVLLENEQNMGVSYSRNRGLKLAKGEYISFIDADDFVSENYIAELYGSIVQENTDLACAHSMYTLKKGKTKLAWQSSTNDSSVMSVGPDNISSLLIGPCFYLYRKSFLAKNNVKFINNLYYEDVIFNWPNFIRAKKIAMAKNNNYMYCCNNVNSTTKRKSSKHLDYVTSWNLVKLWLKDNNMWKDYKYIWLQSVISMVRGRMRRVNDKQMFMYSLCNSLKDEDFQGREFSFAPLEEKLFCNIMSHIDAEKVLKSYQIDKLKHKFKLL